MPRGDKSKYTDKQTRKADPEDEAERRAWATVNKESGGGNKSGSGRGVIGRLRGLGFDDEDLYH